MTFPVPMSIHSFQYGPTMKSTHTFDLGGMSAQVERYRINWRRCLVPLWSSTLLNVRNWRFTSCLQRSSSSTSTGDTASLKKIISKERGGSMLQDGKFNGTKLGNSAKSECFFPVLIFLAWHRWNTALEVPYYTRLWHQGIFNKLWTCYHYKCW